MKHWIPASLLLFILAACNRGGEQQAAGADSLPQPVADSLAPVTEDTHYFWEVDETAPKGFVMKKARPASADSLNAAAILGMLNSQYPELKMELLKSSGDTVFVKVGNSKMLTRQMGSTGAQTVLAELTYNLTEVSGIHYVSLDFVRGDHAAPGTYSRTDFVEDN